MEKEIKFTESKAEVVTPNEKLEVEKTDNGLEKELFNIKESLTAEQDKLGELGLNGKAKKIADAFELVSKLAVGGVDTQKK